MRDYPDMKTSIYALLAAGTLLATPATADDIYTNNGSFKDEGGAVSPARSGFLVGIGAGYAWGDRDIRQTIDREAGIYQNVKPPVEADYAGEDGELSAEEKAEFDADTKLFNEQIDAVLAEVPGSRFENNKFSFPILQDTLSNAGSDDFGAFVYGAEVSYLAPIGSRFALEPFVAIRGYGGNETKIGHNGALGTLSSPYFPGESIQEEHPAFGQTGYATAERNYDVNVALRGHINLRPDTTVFGLVGVQFANASVCGKNS